jgi:crotonobetainyl-CoA:carnitine CoA-transferase CaiB-like acyl-CoA transferase
MIDLMTGSVMSLGLVSAILSARQTGKGCDVDVSLFDVAISSLNYLAHWNLNANSNPTRLARSAHQSLTPCQTYRTKDGWIYLMCNKEKFWELLCEKIDRRQWVSDPRFMKFPDRLINRDLLTHMLDEALLTKTTQEWMDVFEGTVPAAPILDVNDALKNPYVEESGRIGTIKLDDGSALKLMSSPIRAGDHEISDKRAPAMGEHNVEILTDIGLSMTEIDGLKSEGVL